MLFSAPTDQPLTPNEINITILKRVCTSYVGATCFNGHTNVICEVCDKLMYDLNVRWIKPQTVKPITGYLIRWGRRIKQLIVDNILLPDDEFNKTSLQPVRWLLFLSKKNSYNCTCVLIFVNASLSVIWLLYSSFGVSAWFVSIV